MSEYEDDYPCIGVCSPDPESGLCVGCGRPLFADAASRQEMQSSPVAIAADPTTAAAENSSS